jgi:hypothetical protein
LRERFQTSRDKELNVEGKLLVERDEEMMVGWLIERKR